MQNVIFSRQSGDIFAKPVVDGAAAASAAEHQNGLFSRRQPVFFNRFRSPSVKKFFPKRGTAIFPVFEAFRGFGKGGQNVAAFSRHQSVCESGREVAFVREAGDFQFFSREYDGQSHIAALGKYNVGAEGFQAFRGLFLAALA